ncbi:MAG TPA: DNA-formamidopyrimidine glycosylase family protein, partial [Thermoanaerobaculia bacterium]
ALNAALSGKTVQRFETVLPHLARVDDQQRITGRTIEQVVPVGKHLIIDFSGGLHLRTHMRMNGSWHIYRPGERWRRRRDDMRVVIATDDYVAVGFNIPVAEFLDDRALLRQEDLRQIGPDVLGESFEAGEALRRIRERANEEIGNVLLNQRVIAGIGNIWKSEVLFACRVNPFARVEMLNDQQLGCLVTKARKLMTRSAGSEAPNDLSVYGRKRCRRCGSRIEYRKQGLDARGTYWCPRCVS